MAKKVASKKAEPVEVETVEAVHPVLDVDFDVEKRLVALYTLQSVDSKIDKLKIIRGELPQTIEDLEDELQGLNTRIENLNTNVKETEKSNAARKHEMGEHEEAIATYKKQQENVRNSREYESMNKQIEYKELEIQFCEQKIRNGNAKIKELQQHIEAAKELVEQREAELQTKKSELDDIMQETQKDEERLMAKSKEQEQFIEERYLTAYKRIRKAARNGLAVVCVERDACGGCFSKIPPQRRAEISMHKKVIVCEHCGRILVDEEIAKRAEEHLQN